MTVVFATCDLRPLVAHDDEPLAGALSDLGIAVVPIPWTEIDPAGVVDAWPIVLRSTWDSHRMPTMFAAWLAALDESGRVVMNPPAIARDNIDKIYLRGLAAAGIPIPRTLWIDRPDAAGLTQILGDEGRDAAVLKPRIAATAYGTFLISSETDPPEADLAPARAGDFRLQQDFGGSVVETTPSAAVHALASQVMALVAEHCTYARVDIVEADRGPLLMEVELIEPELYFTIVPGSAVRMARTIAARLP